MLLEGIALKVVSPTLEHTLTRDNVKRDERFARALAAAKKLAEGALLEQLPAELEKAAARPDGEVDFRVLFQFAVKRLPRKLLWLRAPGGGALRAADVRGELVVSPRRTPISQRLVATGVAVLEAHPAEGFALAAAQALGLKTLRSADEHFTYAEPATVKVPAGFAAALAELLAGASCPVETVALAPVRGAAEKEPWVFIEALGRPLPVALASRRLERKRKHPVLCLNAAHPSVEGAVPLMKRAPRLSALLWARQLLVRHALLDEKTDAFLTSWALS